MSAPPRHWHRIGPYDQSVGAAYTAADINEQLQSTDETGAAAKATPFDFDAIDAYHDPYSQDVNDLLAELLSSIHEL